MDFTKTSAAIEVADMDMDMVGGAALIARIAATAKPEGSVAACSAVADMAANAAWADEAAVEAGACSARAT